MAPSDIIFAGALSFLIGVFAAGFTANGFVAVAVACCVALGIHARSSRLVKSKYLLVSAVSCLLFGFFYYHFFLNFRAMERVLPAREEKVFSGIVRNDPRVKNGTMHLTLALLPPFRGEIEVLLPETAPVGYGYVVAFQGSIDPPQARYEDPLAVFPEIRSASPGHGSKIKSALLAFKHRMLAVFWKTLRADSAALMAGITLGEQSGFGKELRAEMAASGTTHLVALSGYNIAILVLALEQILRGRIRRRLLGAMTVLAIALFVAMVGGEASIVRAAIMGLLLIVAKQTGREHDMGNAVTATAAVMVAFDPRILLHDVGFQLSFVSLLGIVYLAPAIAEWRRIDMKGETLFSWKENAVTTLSAQLAVLPIILSVFGSASLAGVPANILILAFVPATMAVGFLMGFVGLFFLPLAMLIAFAAEILLRYELLVIKTFAAIPLPAVHPLGGWAIFVVYYGLLIAFVVHMQESARTRGMAHRAAFS